MEEIFRQKKVICPRCKSSKYCRFRYMNNKGRAKKLQPRYICNNCEKYFTLGGKLYDTSLHQSSKTGILPKETSLNFLIASPPPCRSLCDGCTLHAQAPSHSCCIAMGGGCQTFQRVHGEVCCEMNSALGLQSYGTHFCGYPESNICCGSLVKESICCGPLPKWAQRDDGSPQWEQRSYDACSAAEFFPFTFLQNSQEKAAAGTQGINNCLNNIPMFSNIEPMQPFEVFQEKDLDVDLFLSKPLSEKTVYGISVAGGKEVQDEQIGKSSTTLYGGEDMEFHSETDNPFPAGSCNLEEETDWLFDIFEGQDVILNVNGGGNKVCGTELEETDFQGDCTSTGDIANLWNFS